MRLPCDALLQFLYDLSILCYIAESEDECILTPSPFRR